jgi:translation initiation factor 5
MDLPSNGHNINEGEDEDDLDWGEDTSEEAVKARMEALSGGLGGLVIDNDMEKPETDRINIFHLFVKQKIQNGPLTAQVHKDIVGEAERLEIKNKAPIVLCELLFDAKMVKDKQIKKNKGLLIRFCFENQKAQKYLMGGLEKTIETNETTLLTRVPNILKDMYEEDIIDEEVIIDWAKKVSKKYVSKEMAAKIHEKAAPFIKWLKEAEEESESSDGEDDIDLEFDERAKISTIKETSAEPEKSVNKESTPAAAEDDDDDLDIDDI